MLFEILPAEFSETHTKVPAISLVKLNLATGVSNLVCTAKRKWESDEINESIQEEKGHWKQPKETPTLSVKLKPLG